MTGLTGTTHRTTVYLFKERSKSYYVLSWLLVHFC